MNTITPEPNNVIEKTPDIYNPSLDENGTTYIDKIERTTLSSLFSLKCPCNDNVFKSRQNFMQHIKTKIHKSWLENINKNKYNYYVENEKNIKTIKMQQMMLVERDNKILNLENNILLLKNETMSKDCKIKELELYQNTLKKKLKRVKNSNNHIQETDLLDLQSINEIFITPPTITSVED